MSDAQLIAALQRQASDAEGERLRLVAQLIATEAREQVLSAKLAAAVRALVACGCHNSCPDPEPWAPNEPTMHCSRCETLKSIRARGTP